MRKAFGRFSWAILFAIDVPVKDFADVSRYVPHGRSYQRKTDEIAAKIEGFKGMIERAKQAFPNVSVFATTLRQVVSTNCHFWGAIMSEGDNWHVVEPREIHVLDRIGGGDGYVGGMLYAILKGWQPQKWVQFGWASGALVTTLLSDYAQPADEEQIWSIWRGNARVQR